jgi:hypothetical protein
MSFLCHTRQTFIGACALLFLVLIIISALFRTSFSDFAAKYGRDERFKSVDKMRERELLFNEYLLEVRRKESNEGRGPSVKVLVGLFIVVVNVDSAVRLLRFYLFILFIVNL